MPSLNRITWHELNEKGFPENTVAAVNVAGQNVLDPTRRWTPGELPLSPSLCVFQHIEY